MHWSTYINSDDQPWGLCIWARKDAPGIRRSPHSKIALTLSPLVPWNAACQLLNTFKARALWWTLKITIMYGKGNWFCLCYTFALEVSLHLGSNYKLIKGCSHNWMNTVISEICAVSRWHIRITRIKHIGKIQLVVYYQCCVLIGWASTRLYVIAH